MDVLLLSRLQFAITTVYHFFFVPLTLGLGLLVAVMESVYVYTGQEIYKRMTKFWGKLFLINFAMGVVTGIVQEFQFGMNWSEYSRFVGDIFGAPLAIEALLAFFLESTFLGVWLFGWEKLSRKAHLATIWMVAIGANISALWILIANSFMQHPVGYALDGSRAIMVDFGALLTNRYVWSQFPHTLFAGFTTAACFVLGVSIWHLLRRKEVEFFRKSFNMAAGMGIASVILVILVGHTQAQMMVRMQPMKMAAVEALWETENPASFSLFTVGDEKNLKDRFAIRIPNLLSVMAYNQMTGEVQGIRNLQEKYVQDYGPGNYVPSVFTAYWTFRGMVTAGMAILAIMVWAVWIALKDKPVGEKYTWLVPLTILLPYLANSTGWILTEMGRQPWIVMGLLKTEVGFSPNLTVGMVLASLVLFTVVYALLMAADIYLLRKYAKAGPEPAEITVEAGA